jgi:hypothetical protein
MRPSRLLHDPPDPRGGPRPQRGDLRLRHGHLLQRQEHQAHEEQLEEREKENGFLAQHLCFFCETLDFLP